jgi:hypothetical protein
MSLRRRKTTPRRSFGLSCCSAASAPRTATYRNVRGNRRGGAGTGRHRVARHVAGPLNGWQARAASHGRVLPSRLSGYPHPAVHRSLIGPAALPAQNPGIGARMMLIRTFVTVK